MAGGAELCRESARMSLELAGLKSISECAGSEWEELVGEEMRGKEGCMRESG